MIAPTTKMVNGIVVDLTSEEIATITAEWAMNAHTPPRPLSFLVIKNILTTGTVSKLLSVAVSWAVVQDDAGLHDLANRAISDSPTALILVASWLKANPYAALLQGINIKGVQ